MNLSKMNSQTQRNQSIYKNHHRIPKFIYQKEYLQPHKRNETQIIKNVLSSDKKSKLSFKEKQTQSFKNKTLQVQQKPNDNSKSVKQINFKTLNINSPQNQQNKHKKSMITNQKQLKLINLHKRKTFMQFMCSNHNNKVGQFELITNEKIKIKKIYYCQQCAAKLVTQGFCVKKIAQINPFKNQFQFSLKKDNDKVKYQKQIKRFLKQINTTREEHVQVLTKCLGISQVYREQIQLIQNFYNTVIQTVARYRNQHINGLYNQCHSVIADHQREVIHIKKSINQIDGIIIDIKSNFCSIVKNLSANQFQNYFGCYQKTRQMLSSRVHQISQNISQPPSYQISQLQPIVWQINTLIQKVIKSKSSNSKSLYTCIKPLKLSLSQTRKTSNSFEQIRLQKYQNLQKKNQSMTMDRSDSVKNIKKSYQIFQQQHSQIDISEYPQLNKK